MATVVQGRGEYPFDRLVAGLEEARLDLGLSRRKAAKLAGLSPETVGGLERGKSRNWHAAVRLRTALTMLELSTPPEDDPADAMLSELVGRQLDDLAGFQPVGGAA